MENEAHIILAFLFKRSGKNALKNSELYLPLSMELGWCSTKDANDFIKQAVQQGLLVKKDGVLQPTFAVENVEIPLGFIPSKKIFVKEKPDLKKEEDVIDLIVDRISEKTRRDKKDVLNEIKQVENEKNIVPEVAALFVAKVYAVEMEDFFTAVQKKLFIGSTK